MVMDVPRETRELIDRAKTIILSEATRQNLIAASTIPDFETRHVQDALQLLPLIPPGPLLDIGSGAGLPGLIIACVTSAPVHLVEPRAKRATFLKAAAAELGLTNVQVHQLKVERLGLPPVEVIVARAVAKLSSIFEMAMHLSTETTRWILPKGRSAAAELEEARRTWQGEFSLRPSVTDPEAAIVIASHVARRRSR